MLTPFSLQHAQVLLSLVTFNSAILKTSFFTPTKVAISFRLDPSFLPESEYPVKAYGLFLVVGDGFRGFHLRFKDVARGGLRMIQSRNRENYSINQRNLFDEVYGLASTQALKNKDIPEGGSKGAILPDIGVNSERAFQHFVDSLLDLLLPGKTPGVKDKIVDLYGKEEIVRPFLPPLSPRTVLTHTLACSSSSDPTKERPPTWIGSPTMLVLVAPPGGRLLRPARARPRTEVFPTTSTG